MKKALRALFLAALAVLAVLYGTVAVCHSALDLLARMHEIRARVLLEACLQDPECGPRWILPQQGGGRPYTI